MYTFKIETRTDSDWNQNLLKNNSGNFYQSIEYLTSTSDQYFPVYISILNENNDIVGQLGINIIRTSVLYSSPLLRKFLKLISGITTRGIWLYGPIIHCR